MLPQKVLLTDVRPRRKVDGSPEVIIELNDYETTDSLRPLVLSIEDTEELIVNLFQVLSFLGDEKATEILEENFKIEDE
jgi:hypothetical protein